MKSYICLLLSILLQLVWHLYVHPCCYKGWAVFHSICTPSSSFIHRCFSNCITLVSGSLGSGLVRMHPGKGVPLGAFMWPIHLPSDSALSLSALSACLLGEDCRSEAGFTHHCFLFPPQNLDALHDHLATIYPGMRAPSFRCTDAEKGKGLILHCLLRERRAADIVIGIIKTVAQQIHGTEIDMKVMGNKGGSSEHRWHVRLERLPICPWTLLLGTSAEV